MNPNISQPLTVLSNDEIRAILVKRIDQQKQAIGIVVGIIEPAGRRVVAHGSLATGDPRTPDGDTIFEIGSITKIFTSLLLADMVNRKEVALDDPAARYLPENVRVPERSGKSITLLDLSTHSSGLPPNPTNVKLNPLNPHAADYSVTDLYQFLSGYTLARDPGSAVEYSNLGAGLLGHLLANRAGTDYESLVGSRITRPLSMPDTGIALSSSMARRMAVGHNAMLAPVANSVFPTPFAGAGALRSSANDMLTFLEACMGCKESPLAPAMKAMLELRRTTDKAKIGLGWLLNSADGKEIAMHDGGTGGFRSFIGFDPKARIGVVVLSNGARSGVEDIGIHLLNPAWPLANPEPPSKHTEIHIDPGLLGNYTGRYRMTPNLILEITRDGDRLFAQGFGQLPHSQPGELTALPKFELFAEGEKNFFARVNDSQYVFETGLDGRATSLIRDQAGRESMRCPRLS